MADRQRQASKGRSRRRGRVRISGVLLIGLSLLIPSGSALAHRLQVFASADGDSIQGKAYSVGGHPARGVEIQVLDAAGEPVATVISDDDGRFRVRVPAAKDYRVVAKSGDGHRAEWPISASELLGAFEERLSSSAAARTAASNSSPGDPRPADGFGHAGASGASDGADAGADLADVEYLTRFAPSQPLSDAPGEGIDAVSAGCLPLGSDLEPALRALIAREIHQSIGVGLERSVEQAVAQQLLPLREALAEAQGQASFRDILGGIGYIAGLAGFGLWWTRRRDSRQSETNHPDG